ncbi:hypothetical protein LINGRAHAP2_LOCUS4667 [Linum grandiflorum]
MSEGDGSRAATGLCGLGSGLGGFGSRQGTKRAAVVGGHGYGVHNRRRWVIVLTDC